MGSRRDSANRQSTANDRSGCHICYCWIPCCCDCCGERQQPSRPVSNPSSSRRSTPVPVQASQTRSSQTNPSRQRRSPRQPIHPSDVTAGTSSANLSRPPSYFPRETFAPSAQSGDDDVISPVTPSPAKWRRDPRSVEMSHG